MSWKSIFLGSALTAAVAAGAFYAGAGIGSHPARADVSSHWSAERRHGDGRVGRLCETDDGARLDLLVAYARDRLDLRAEQGPAWRDLEGALRGGIATLRTACDPVRAGSAGASAPARLAAAEAAMTAGADALRQLRPAFEAFYATLDDRQKATLDDALAHGRRR